MPTYEARCESCGTETEYIRAIVACLDTPECCGHKMKKVILSAPRGFVENIAYQSPVDGRPILSKRAREEDLRRHGCREWEGLEQEKKYAARAKADIEWADEAKIEKWVGEAYHALPPDKKQVLENAVT